MAASADAAASIWKVPILPTWPNAPHVVLKGHSGSVNGCAFLGDESHVVTVSKDGSLRAWRVEDGVQTAIYECGHVRAATLLMAFIVVFHWLTFATGDVIVVPRRERFDGDWHPRRQGRDVADRWKGPRGRQCVHVRPRASGVSKEQSEQD